jgi:hypothetical protein
VKPALTTAQFLTVYGNVAGNLSSLLGMRFVPGSPAAASPIGRTLATISGYYNRGMVLTSECEMMKMVMLVKHLREIERHDGELLEKFKDDLYNRPTASQYYGIRCEIATAATLVRRGIAFSKQESPDFRIAVDGHELFVECGSAHISALVAKDIKYKVGSVINQKSRKPYCVPCAALFIDVTSISGASGDPAIFWQDIRPFVENELRSSAFGAVLLFEYLYDVDRRCFNQGYMRVDSQHISAPLCALLDQHWPRGQQVSRHYTTPRLV